MRKTLLASAAIIALAVAANAQVSTGLINYGGGGTSGGGGGGGTPGGATNTTQYNAGGGTFGGVGPGTTTTLLHGNAAGAPTFSAVDLNADVTGNLAVSHLNSGTSASSTTFWRGDGTWATPSGSAGANPTATIGAAAVNGVSTSFMRSDAAPALPATLPALSAANLTNIPMANASGILAGANGGTANGFFAVTGPATSLKTFTLPNVSTTILTTNAAVTVAQGGTGLASGTSGGIPYFNSTTTMLSSALLTANALVLGGGAGAAPAPMGSLGTTTTVLHGNAAGAPTFAAVSLTADVSGILPAANGGAGSVSGVLQANGSGTVAAATIGNGLNYTAPTLALTNTLNAQVGTSYALASTDAAKIITASNASAQAYTIVQATTAGFTSGYGTSISNIGAGTVTLTATTSTFGNGLTTLGIAPGQVADIGSNGTNYPFTAMSLPVVVAGGFLANNTGTNNYPISLTATQATAMLNNFTSTLAGLAPLSGGGTTNFLRADGTWAAPAGGSGCTVAGTAGQAVYNNGSTGCLSSAATFTSGGGLTLPVAGAASTPGLTLSGAPFTGGSGTTTFPQLYLNSGTAPTTWATTGTAIGVNLPNASTVNFLDFRVNGGASVFKVASTGAVTAAGVTATGLDISGASSQNINMSATSSILAGGVTAFGFFGGQSFFGQDMLVSTGAMIPFATVSGTVPSIIMNSTVRTTGWGAQAATNISGIIAGVEKIRLTAEGVQYKQATAPVPTGTGSPTIATGSTDEAGEVTAGTSATSVIITFNLTHTNAPFCVVTAQPQISSFAYTLSSTAITITQTATSADKIDYRCTFP